VALCSAAATELRHSRKVVSPRREQNYCDADSETSFMSSTNVNNIEDYSPKYEVSW